MVPSVYYPEVLGQSDGRNKSQEWLESEGQTGDVGGDVLCFPSGSYSGRCTRQSSSNVGKFVFWLQKK